MKRLGRDFWTILGVIATILGIILTLAFPALTKDKTALSGEVVSSSVMLDAPRDLVGDLEVRYRDKPISTISLVTIEIANTGTAAIERSKFDRPIQIRFVGAHRILNAKVANTIPAGLDANLAPAEAGLTLQPLLLNPKDRVQIQALIDGHVERTSILARIAGMREVEIANSDSGKTRARSIFLIVSGLLLVATYGALMAMIFGPMSRMFQDVTLPAWIAAPLALSCCAGGAALVVLGFRLIEIESMGSVRLVAIPVLILGMALGGWIRWRQARANARAWSS